MKKIIIITLFCLNLIFPIITFAQIDNPEPPERFTRTILPESQVRGNANCRLVITRFEQIYFFELDNNNGEDSADLGSVKRFFDALEKLKEFNDPLFGQINSTASGDDESVSNTGVPFANLNQNDVLGCALLTGRIKMFYLSIFISYALNMIAILAGSISMLFIMIGGYKYVIGSLTQNTDDAKKTIINAIIGLLVSTSAWIIVNLVQTIVSS
jgi:hypothetical protein